jgi:hypothetical protein
MREIRLSGSEGGGELRLSPYPYLDESILTPSFDIRLVASPLPR